MELTIDKLYQVNRRTECRNSCAAQSTFFHERNPRLLVWEEANYQ